MKDSTTPTVPSDVTEAISVILAQGGIGIRMQPHPRTAEGIRRNLEWLCMPTRTLQEELANAKQCGSGNSDRVPNMQRALRTKRVLNIYTANTVDDVVSALRTYLDVYDTDSDIALFISELRLSQILTSPPQRVVDDECAQNGNDGGGDDDCNTPPETNIPTVTEREPGISHRDEIRESLRRRQEGM